MGFNYLFIFPPDYVALCGSKARHRLSSESVPGIWKPLFLRLPSQDRAPSLPLLSLFFVFYIFSYLFLKTMSCFSGYLIVLYLDSEVVLWNLLSVEMFF